ncbi:MAG TPA: alpha/beta hydrolase [Steroidobacteraceae bacterium]|nr:alpha/beta hydrolase [Steroidobacteraceae bacterium]
MFTPCRLEHPTHLVAVQAECGTLSVPENPAGSGGRQILLRVARVPAINLHKQPDALFVLAGGPGMAATAFYTTAAAALARIHRDRDLVLVDQRGTGGSNALDCNMDEEALWRSPGAALEEQTRRCLAALTAHAAVAFYTTSVAVLDLDRVRDALGLASIDLYGVSYGTRVAQHYLRHFPQHTRAVILDGAVPPQTALGASLALDAQAALENIFERCRNASACRARFGDPEVTYRKVHDTLTRHPVSVHLADPTTGEPRSMQFTQLQLATVLRLSSYTSEQAAVLPLILGAAGTHGDYGPLAAQFLIADRSYEDVLAFGMHNTVVCSEDVPRYRQAALDRTRLASTFLGTTELDALERVCALWPRGPVDADFHTPLHSATPVLLLVGGNDPITPPAYGRQVSLGLPNSVLLELEGMGHGQLAAPCVDRIMARFLERGSAAGLDLACARRARPAPFFTSFAGPAP